jgi:predicted alpha-1,2-mannosidase
MHDVEGLVALMGGKEKFIEKLDQNFSEDHYRHDNEPGHHYPYLYNYVGKPSRTQELVREIADVHYRNAPDGLSGNDDCGQMSAWLVFSSMGFYPVSPASGEYAIGAPLFKKITLRLPGSRSGLVIEARNLSANNKYVKSVHVDGVKWKAPFLRHDDLMKAKNITFEMSGVPHDNWGD